MSQPQGDIRDFHWLVEVLQTVDIGIVVLDMEFNITAWNGFIENNSGVDSAEALGQNIFNVFDDLSEQWFKHKAETVIQLRNRAFTTWEQRPYVFKFKNTRPVTGVTDYMYQNTTFIPVANVTGQIENLAIIVYDVTDTATSKVELRDANEQLALMSRTDGLTQMLNRSHWEELLEMEFLRQQRNPRELSLIMLDIDHFKNVNDTYGHQAGDDVIRAVAKVMLDNSRVTDFSGRYGGEEFSLVLIDADEQSSYQLAERLRKKIEQTSVSVASGEVFVTVSLGVAGWRPSMKEYSQWIEVADQALYASKRNGRNRTTVAP
jgi:diguanylate cyclase (GGDEF)-like protein/PAS domain S-box-containing protein